MMKKSEALIRLVDRACVRELEDILLLHAGDEPRIDEAVSHVSRELFGIAPEDTFYAAPDNYDSMSIFERIKFDRAAQEYEESFDTGEDLTDDENMEVLRRLGLDFSDDRGQPLRCTKLLSRVAEMAAKGIKGKMPDAVMQWGDALARERDAFLANKRR